MTRRDAARAAVGPWALVMTLVVALALGGCVRSEAVACEGGTTCPAGTVCGPGPTPVCIEPAQLEACADKLERDPCAYPGLTAGNCIDGLCVAAVCGNAILDANEACDDGNTTGGDGCSAACDSAETCGNGVTDALAVEECDDGTVGLSGDGCTSRCKVEFPTWHDASPAPISRRQGAAMAFDAVRGRILLFGGQTETDRLGDTWEWDGARWNLRTPVTSPPRRAFHVMAYDAERRVIVLHGGLGDSGDLVDTWTWDGRTWTEVVSPVTPPARREGAMVFDTQRGVMVLVGGSATVDAALAAQTWEWNGAAWAQRTDLVGTPPVVNGLGLVYDEVRHVVVLYGGRNPAAAEWLQQTWEYDGATWTNRQAAPPRAAAFGAMVYDPVRARTVLVGGLALSTFSLVRETWEWDGTTWSEVTDSTSPDVRTRASIAYDRVAGAVVLFGGSITNAPIPPLLDDTWRRVATTWEAMPSFAVAPQARDGAAAAYDAAHGRTVMFGGKVGNAVLGDTWEWESGIWSSRKPPNSPVGRYEPAMAFDAARERVVLFGGGAGLAEFDDTWEWDGEDWLQRAPASRPPARYAHAMAYDAAHRQVVLFGGAFSAGGRTVRDDTWTWDGTTWAEPTVASRPPARLDAAVAYDPVRERVVLFGGADANFTRLGDTWEWDGATWTQQHPAVAPAPRYGHRLAYDAQRRRVVLTGGDFGDVWAWDGAAWTPVVSIERPPARGDHVMVFDAVRRSLVVFGGHGLNFTTIGDTWELRHEAPLQPVEACALAPADDDGDGLAGCDDPDCWGRCAPACPPGAACPLAAPRCGDGACAPIEDPFLCPSDCP